MFEILKGCARFVYNNCAIGKIGSDAIKILSRDYRLSVIESSQQKRILDIAVMYRGLRNANEVAVLFIVELARYIEPTHPRFKKFSLEMEKHIQVAKGNFNRGVLSEDILNDLCDVANSRFGIDTSV